MIPLSRIDQDILVGRYISILYRQSQAFISKQLHPYNIGYGQYSILLALQNNDGIMQEKLCSILGADKGSIARSVIKLQKEGYLIREIDSEDRRILRIHLTEKGLKVLPIIKNTLKEWNSFISSGLSEYEQDNLVRTLEIMTNEIGTK